MNRLISQFLAVTLVVGSLSFTSQAETTSSGAVDFGKFSEADNASTYVEVNIGQTLISLAAKLVEKQQPEAAKLLRSVHGVRVNVVGLTDKNRKDTELRVQGIRNQLNKDGWLRIVTVQEKAQDVGVFIKARGDEALEGVVVTAIDGKKKEAVFINVVGDIKPEQIAEVGEALHIDQLKKINGKAKDDYFLFYL